MAAPNNMHNLTTLIKRLEAATSRLEDIATSTFEAPSKGTAVSSVPAPPPPPPPPSAAPIPPVAPPPPPAPAPAPAPVEEDLPAFLEDFDTILNTEVKKYVDVSEKLGGPVAKQASYVAEAFAGQRKFLLISTKAKKPDMSSPAFMELLQPLQEGIQKVSEVREGSRGDPMFNNLSAVSESISVLAWVTFEAKPQKHVDESLGSAQYWGNRVLKEFKEKNPQQVEWVQSYYHIFKTLSEYAKEYFNSGIPWNAKGVDVAEALKQTSAPAAPVPPPPPAGGLAPPPPPPAFGAPPPAPAAGESSHDALLSELNKGEAITKSLRKVDASQMTHKNPSLRAGASVPSRSDSQDSVSRNKSPAPSKKPKPESMRTKKPARKELENNKWIVENFDNEPQPVTIQVSMNQSILISRCSKTTIILRGKANAISIDNSPRLSLVVESLVSSVDVIKSANFAMQVMGTLPTVMLDQVDNAQIYLGKDSLSTEVYSSKCSGVNINIQADEDADFVEMPVPEQIRTVMDSDGKMKSEIVEHAG